jgi:hypothetical protein
MARCKMSAVIGWWAKGMRVLLGFEFMLFSLGFGFFGDTVDSVTGM